MGEHTDTKSSRMVLDIPDSKTGNVKECRENVHSRLPSNVRSKFRDDLKFLGPDSNGMDPDVSDAENKDVTAPPTSTIAAPAGNAASRSIRSRLYRYRSSPCHPPPSR